MVNRGEEKVRLHMNVVPRSTMDTLFRLVSSLLYGTQTMLVLNLPAFENRKYTAYTCFQENGPYSKILTKKEPIRTLRFTFRLRCHNIITK